jgi:hypothetical protein
VSDEPAYRLDVGVDQQRFVLGRRPEEQREIVEQLQRIRVQPFPAPGNGIARIRLGTPVTQPTFFSVTGHFAIYHTVEDDLVAVFEIVERKPIRIE